MLGKVELTKEEKQQAKMAATRITVILDVIAKEKFDETLFTHFDEDGNEMLGLIGGAYEEIKAAIQKEIEGTLEYLKLLDNLK